MSDVYPQGCRACWLERQIAAAVLAGDEAKAASLYQLNYAVHTGCRKGGAGLSTAAAGGALTLSRLIGSLAGTLDARGMEQAADRLHQLLHAAEGRPDLETWVIDGLIAEWVRVVDSATVSIDAELPPMVMTAEDLKEKIEQDPRSLVFAAHIAAWSFGATNEDPGFKVDPQTLAYCARVICGIQEIVSDAMGVFVAPELFINGRKPQGEN